MDQIQHWKHPSHPLLFREDHHRVIYCRICYKSTADHNGYYACDSCEFYLHKSCADVPFQINHPFHPSHTLTLASRWDYRSYTCDSCHNFFDFPCFGCSQCSFYMDVECALMPPITCEGRDHIQHFTHQHPMPLVEAGDKNKIKCFGCHSTCSSSVVYGCTKCQHFLHKSCAELPPKIRYLAPYPNHILFNLLVTHEEFICSSCHWRSQNTLTFNCNECDFKLCVKCGKEALSGGTIKGSIRYEDHEHLLSFLEVKCTKIGHCDSHEAYCKQPAVSDSIEMNHSNSSIFRCLECDFKVHLLCGPLPLTIKYEYHIHPLIIVDSHTENSSGEYYCDICESERDPRIRVYHCEVCKYVAHVHCLISEIAKVVNGDLRDVKLKTIGADYWELPAGVAEEELTKTTMTFKDLINKLPPIELQWFKRHFEWDTSSDEEEKKGQQEMGQRTIHQLDLRDDYIDELLRLSCFNHRDFDHFIDELHSNFFKRKLKISSSDLVLKICVVEGYMVPFTFARVLKMLLQKYGDISLRSQSSLEMRSIVFSFLCKVVTQMHSTRVQDVTKDLLKDWYLYSRFAYYMADFVPDILEKPLEKITRAFVGFQLRKLEVEVPTTLNKKIAEMQHKLKVCQKFLKTKPKLAEECLNEAEEVEWKTAFEV